MDGATLETKKLRMLTETGRLGALLESLVRSLGFLPENAERLTERAAAGPLAADR